jgi:hypothetical protein
VDFEPLSPERPQPAVVYVGSELYGSGETRATLDKNPVTAQQNSLVLPLVEPRGYAANETFSLTYEGAILREPLVSGFFDAVGGRLDDVAANFCNRGVYSVELMREYAAERFGLDGEALETFARQHADYVQITSGFPGKKDNYWRARAGVCSLDSCENLFGEPDARELSPLRDLRILEAYQDYLVVEPREYANEEARAELAAQIDCCFPAGASYTIRAAEQWVLTGSASGFRHDVVAREQADGSFRCERDCDPRKKYYQSRVFEVSRAPGTSCPETAETDVCPVGEANDSDCFAPNAAGCGAPACVYDPESAAGHVVPGGEGSACILDSLNARFVVYRGANPSLRNMVFSWQVTGGFTPLAMSLTTEASSVVPQSMLYLPELQHLAVVDASTLGLALFSLDSLRLERPFY